MSSLEPIQAKIGDKTYKVGLLTLQIKETFKRWVEKEELALIKEGRYDQAEDEYDRALSTHRFKVKNGLYELGSAESIRWINCKSGFRFILWNLFSAGGNILTEDEIGNLVESFPAEIKEAWDQVCELSSDAVKKKIVGF